ncbi:hypothetical protein J4219_02055 [Candidatus Woesearchaeota archaeon]|nr:hypothetical protein [Candidatus Woesearchaeota archaeon]
MKRYIFGMALAVSFNGCESVDIAAEVQNELDRQRTPELRRDVDNYRSRLEDIEGRYERLGIRSAANVQGLDLLEQKINSLYLRMLEQDARTFQLSLDATAEETRERRDAVETEANFRRETTTRVLDYVQTTHTLLIARNDVYSIRQEIETRRDRMTLRYVIRIMNATEQEKQDLLRQYSLEDRTLEETYQPRIRELDAQIEQLQQAFEQYPQRVNTVGRRPRRVS